MTGRDDILVQVICGKCEHTARHHEPEGAHKCSIPECECRYFAFKEPIQTNNYLLPQPESRSAYEIFNDTKNLVKGLNESLKESNKEVETDALNTTDWDLQPGEVRTVSSTGGEKGVKPERYELIPVEAMDIMARLYGFGAEKYAAHNWRKGYDWSKSYASLMRHATRFWAGEDLDSETGLPHLAGAAFHCFTLMVFMQEHPDFDDRFKKVDPEAGRSSEVVESIVDIDLEFPNVSPVKTELEIFDELVQDLHTRKYFPDEKSFAELPSFIRERLVEDAKERAHKKFLKTQPANQDLVEKLSSISGDERLTGDQQHKLSQIIAGLLWDQA